MRFTEQENLSLFEFSFIMNVSASILSLSDNYLSMATASNCSCSANVAPDQSHNQLLPVILTMHKFSCSMEEIKVRTNSHCRQNYFYGTDQKCFPSYVCPICKFPPQSSSQAAWPEHTCSFPFVSSFFFFPP